MIFCKRNKFKMATIFDLEETCFREYRDAMKDAVKEQKIITDSEWGEWHRNHTRNRDNALNFFEKNSASFKKKSVEEAKQSLIQRIHKEYTDLIKINEMREATEAAKECLRQSKAVAEESTKTLTNLYATREEQNKKLEENEARIKQLNAQQSTAQEQYSNITNDIESVEHCMANLALQNDMQKKEQNSLLQESQANAQRLNELEQILKNKKSKKNKKEQKSNKGFKR
ncbi:hypothetical protein B566_EDAN001639 [Ephemera danica]|nr:hypothetical protein B566_EDAN001639 [Ephemera danica]